MTLFIYAYLRMSTQFCLKKTHVFVELTLFFVIKNEAHSAKIILFSKNVFKIKIMLCRSLFLILRTLAVKMWSYLSFKVASQTLSIIFKIQRISGSTVWVFIQFVFIVCPSQGQQKYIETKMLNIYFYYIYSFLKKQKEVRK